MSMRRSTVLCCFWVVVGVAVFMALPAKSCFGKLPPPLADWKETNIYHIISIDIPGARMEDMNIKVDEKYRTLEIFVEAIREDIDVEFEKWHLSERPIKLYSRQFRIPTNADLESMKVQVENGVMRITIPKTATAIAEESKIINKFRALRSTLSTGAYVYW